MADLGEAANGPDTLTQLQRTNPEVLLLDYKMPGLGRLSSFCQETRQISPKTRTVMVSGYADDQAAVEAACGGALGYVLKGSSIDELIEAIEVIRQGQVWADPQLSQDFQQAFLQAGRSHQGSLEGLSRQELRILTSVARGMTNKEIAASLFLSPKTVKKPCDAYLRKAWGKDAYRGVTLPSGRATTPSALTIAAYH
jgi:two-component system NarL family response regulator